MGIEWLGNGMVFFSIYAIDYTKAFPGMVFPRSRERSPYYAYLVIPGGIVQGMRYIPYNTRGDVREGERGKEPGEGILERYRTI